MVDKNQAADGGSKAQSRPVQFRYRQQLRGRDVVALRVDGVAPSGYAMDRATIRQRMDAIQGQAMALATQRHREQELARIAAALERLRDGSSGYCLGCGEEIAEKRLRFDPSIATCIRCTAGAQG